MKLVAAVPPKLTALALVKPVPIITTELPVPVVAGVNEEMVGTAEYANPANVAVPPGVVTLTEPVVPVPTTAGNLRGRTGCDFVLPPVPPNSLRWGAGKARSRYRHLHPPVPAVVGVNEVIVGVDAAALPKQLPPFMADISNLRTGCAAKLDISSA